MAMGSSGVAGKAASVEETSGHGVNSLGDAQHRPGAGKRAPRRALQRATRRFHRAVESQGLVLEAGRPVRRGRPLRFLEQLCFQLQASVRDGQRTLECLQSSVEKVRDAEDALSDRIRMQARLTGERLKRLEAEARDVPRAISVGSAPSGTECEVGNIQTQREQGECSELVYSASENDDVDACELEEAPAASRGSMSSASEVAEV